MDSLLYALGTFTLPDAKNGIYTPDPNYYQETLNKNTIRIFKNWRALCLYDSLTRVSIELDIHDKYRLWENEYILIYIYVLQAQYYMYRVGSELARHQTSLKESKVLRNNFIAFMNTFEHQKISYKYLPNLLFDRFKSALDIQEEVDLVENKINRINKELQEKSDKRIDRILLFLTLITIVSVAHDTGQLFSTFINPDNKGVAQISASVIALIICIATLFLLRRRSKED